MKEIAMTKTRAPIVDGIFYPSDPNTLRETIQRLLDEAAAPERTSDVTAIIVPHAAYSLAGPVQAAAFRAVAHRPIERVVILAPVHRDPDARIILSESTVFHTPLGDLTVDNQPNLEDWGTHFVRDDVPHLEEHCIEVLLPYVRFLFPRASIVPILIGRPGFKTVRLLAHALERELQGDLERTLLIATTNLNSPYDERAHSDDADRFLELLEGGSGEEITRAALEGTISACGAFGVAVLMEGFRFKPSVVARGDSGKTSPRSVRYAALTLSIRKNP